MTDSLDPRIGQHGGREPFVCAQTGQPVRGRHATTYSLNDSYYFRILVKASHLADIPAITKALNALVTPARNHQPKVKLEEKEIDNEQQS